MRDALSGKHASEERVLFPQGGYDLLKRVVFFARCDQAARQHRRAVFEFAQGFLALSL